MSNKIVPNIYRAVIDDVILHIKDEFDEYGVAEDVLAELQNKWENKVIASRVAEFETPQQAVPPPVASSQHHHAYAPHMQHAQYLPHNPYAAIAASANQSAVKSEPVDNRFMLTPSMQYSLPPLPGPSINGSRQVAAPPHPGGQTGVLSFPRAAPAPTARYTPTTQQPAQSQPLPTQTASQRMPQTDGPSQSSEDEDSPSPPGSQPAFAPRASHPSLPQPSLPPSSTQSSQQEDLEAINSDLDDSDTEGEDDAEEGAAGETDIVFCTYDKVARVKNKWKCILKDGMIHVNGKDYLFAKCTGEFEW